MDSAKNLRKFLQGMQFSLKARGLRLNVYTDSNEIIKDKQVIPNFTFDIENFVFGINCQSQPALNNLAIKMHISLRSIMIIESSKSKARMGNGALTSGTRGSF